MKIIDNVISKEEFQKHKNKLTKEKVDAIIERNIEMLAKEMFDEARYTSDRLEAYKKAVDAYDLYPTNYQYMTFAISKLVDNNKKEEEYLELINTIDREIINSKEGMYIFFKEDEIYSYRYKELKYRYCCLLIENKKYEKAFKELKEFNKKYSYIEFKVKHLILNLAIMLDKKDDFLNEYNSIKGSESILYKLPLLYLFIKTKNFIYAKKEIIKINQLNHYLMNIILNINDENTKKEIDNSKSSYYIASKEEALFALKYFRNLYADEEFQKYIRENKE